MLQIRQFFNTRKRALTSSAVAVAILALAGTGTAFATETVARNTSIGSGNAQNFAFADAGVDPTSATGIRTEFDFEQGQFIYKSSFLLMEQNTNIGSRLPMEVSLKKSRI